MDDRRRPTNVGQFPTMAEAWTTAAVLLCTLLLQPSAATTTTLDDFLSFPTHSNLVSGSQACAHSIAWIELTRGVNNVFLVPNILATPPTPVQITNFTQDDGSEMLNLQLFSSNSHCVPIFILGPTAGANPNHNVAPPTYGTYLPKDITVFPPTMVRVVDELYQATSPNGDNILYVTSGDALSSANVYSLPTVSNKATGSTDPTFLFAVKQGSLSIDEWTTVNGQEVILFSNNRGDHGFIGMYVDGVPVINWLSASIDTDVNARLSPDGTNVAFLRLLGPQMPGDRGLGGHRGANFEVWVVPLSRDTVPGQATRVYQDQDGFPDGGSGYGMRAMDWLDKSTLVFGSEKSGWCHPLVLDVSLPIGTPPIDVFGEDQQCEAKSWSVQHNLCLVVHNNCNGNLDTRSISQFSSGNLQTLHTVVAGTTTSGYGMSASGSGAVAVGGEKVVYIATSVTQATSVQSNAFGRLSALWTLPKHTTPETITFPASDDSNFIIHGQLFSTTNRTSKGTVIFTHGGSQRQMFPYFHFGSCYGALYAFNQYISTVLGYDVLSINYRSGIGYGKAFRVCKQCMWLGGREYIDVLAGARWLQKNYPEKMNIGIHGLSYGGLNVLQAMARDPQVFAVGVANAPVYNWISQSRYDRESFVDVEPAWNRGFNALPIGPDPDAASPEWLSSVVPKAQQLAWSSSPSSHVANLTGPLLLIQGDADNEVAFSESVGLMRAVRALGRDNVVSKVFPDETHGLARYAAQVEAAELTAAFLRMHLGGV